MENFGTVTISDGDVEELEMGAAAKAVLLYSPVPVKYSLNQDFITAANAAKIGYHPGNGQKYLQLPQNEKITSIFVQRVDSGDTGVLYAEETQNFNGYPGMFLPVNKQALTLALNNPSSIRLAGYPAAGDNNGHGSTNTSIVLFNSSPAADEGNADMTDAYSATAGSKITLNTAGYYLAFANLALAGAGTAYLCLGTVANTLAAGEVRAKAKGGANSVLSFGAPIKATAGQELYVHCAANLESPNSNATDNQLIVIGPLYGPALALA